MPLGRYFAFAGSLLLALMFAAPWYMPQLPVTPARVEYDKGIRIESRHRWPQKIVFDTSLPIIVPPAAIAELTPNLTPPVASNPAPEARSPRDAFALAERATLQAEPLPSTVARKPVKRPQQRTRSARAIPAPVAREVPAGFRIALPAGW